MLENVSGSLVLQDDVTGCKSPQGNVANSLDRVFAKVLRKKSKVLRGTKSLSNIAGSHGPQINIPSYSNC